MHEWGTWIKRAGMGQLEKVGQQESSWGEVWDNKTYIENVFPCRFKNSVNQVHPPIQMETGNRETRPYQ